MRTLLYVHFDRSVDATLASHEANLKGLSSAIGGMLDAPGIVPVHARELADFGDAEVRARWGDAGLFVAGSFTEWFQLGVDGGFARVVQGITPLLLRTRLPLLAVCGGHQLLALAHGGASALGHMAGLSLEDELALPVPRLRAPSPRWGQEGTYALSFTKDAEGDPLFGPLRGTSPFWVSQHHKDEVRPHALPALGATLLAADDPELRARTRATDQGACVVQALRYRPLCYGVQFHPEIPRFAEATHDDGGAGAQLLRSFVALARQG